MVKKKLTRSEGQPNHTGRRAVDSNKVILFLVDCQGISPGDCNNVYDNALLLSIGCNSVLAVDGNSGFDCGLESGGCNRLSSKV